MLRLALIAALALPAAASAQDRQAASGQPPQRIRSVTVTGNEKCPASSDTEIVVCSRINPGELYRIPAPLRETAPSAANQSWVNRAATVDSVGRTAAGLPDTCSAIGSGGFTGCFQQRAEAWAAEKRAAAAGAAPPEGR